MERNKKLTKKKQKQKNGIVSDNKFEMNECENVRNEMWRVEM